jgi:hypothetical protein
MHVGLGEKKDVYYTVTPRACSCPSAIYRLGKACKHQRKYFPDAAREGSDNSQSLNLAEVLKENDQNLPKMPSSYQRMAKAVREEIVGDPESIKPEGKWAGGRNGPVDPEIPRKFMHNVFPLRQLLATPGALEAFKEESYRPYITRHLNENCGDLGQADKAENELSLGHGFRLLSDYDLPRGGKIWIITVADRSATTILTPEEY